MLSNPNLYFGIHSATPYNRTTGEFYGTMRVLKGSNLALTGENIPLTGGSFNFPWGVETGLITTEITLGFAEYPSFLYELAMGKAPTDNSAEATGSVTSLTNVNGTSIQDATTGIDSVGIKSGSEADLKFTKYLVKYTSATTVDVYAASDVDFTRGTDKSFENDSLKITASPLTISTGAATEVPGYGIELTGGSGTIDFTSGDTASFSVRPPNSKSMDVTIGGTTDTFAEFGLILYGQQRGTSEMVEADVFRVKAAGLPIVMNPKEWSETEITLTAFYDSSKSGILSMRTVDPT